MIIISKSGAKAGHYMLAASMKRMYVRYIYRTQEEQQMKESIIRELYEDAVSRAELIMPEGIRYQTCCERKEEAEQQLKETLSAHQRELFEQFLAAQAYVRNIEDEETYRQGVSLGVRITAEAFVRGSVEEN